MPQADDLIERAQEVWANGRYNKVRMTYEFSNGARVRFRPLQTVSDAQKYQGQNLQDALIEEVGNYADAAPIDRLFGVLRSAKGYPVSLFMTGNPGGPGQQWIKGRYIDPNPQGMTPLIRSLEYKGQKFTHRTIFIPSFIRDNKILLDSDPNYIARLHLVGSSQLVNAWLEGDWNAIEGAYFDNWSTQRHVCEPFEIPEHWLRFRSLDWGSYRPFSVGWWAVASDDHRLSNGCTLPRGGLVRFNEWYGASKPNTGLKLTVEEVAAGIKKRSDGLGITYTVADPAIFAADGGPSMAERFAIAGVPCKRGDNARVQRGGNMGGWDQMRHRLTGETPERPMIVCFDTCVDSIRTIPALQHDEAKPEDLDTSAEDHAADEWRYACMSRPWTRDAPEDYDPIARMQKPMTWDEQMQLVEQAQQQGRRI
jgi:hypothetical protein